ncbi:MarR family winged helix-turn-helix transcriptional regulator [Fodinicola acaciae]|uniref:MarR family winged helix-turn-helix transcriptional regulator n=1 Tax=Fodinicola acaciae TaxID=2681555 RepID=UPI0013D3F4DC|nr:MarR family transcriptional regulator [Fodinicola acaciae]
MSVVIEPSTNRDLILGWGAVIGGFSRTSQQLMAQLTDELGYPAGWFEILMRLLWTGDERGIPMTTLAREVSLTSGGFTKIADRMVDAGLMTRTTCASDRRKTYAQLTPTGREVAERAERVHAEGLKQYVVDVLGTEDTATLVRIMGILRDTHGC